MMRRYGRHSSFGIAAVLVVVLSSCSRPTVAAPTERLSVQISLTTTHVVAGPRLKGTLIATNPGDPINLNVASKGCRPAFQVFLQKGDINSATGFNEPCLSTPFIIEHGINRLAFSTFTTYTRCAPPDGTISAESPPCLSSGAYPLLPAGSYQAVVEWTNTVPVPTSAAVTVTLTDKTS
jgi:uncharacterized lipoprotein YbaY